MFAIAFLLNLAFRKLETSYPSLLLPARLGSNLGTCLFGYWISSEWLQMPLILSFFLIIMCLWLFIVTLIGIVGKTPCQRFFCMLSLKSMVGFYCLFCYIVSRLPQAQVRCFGYFILLCVCALHVQHWQLVGVVVLSILLGVSSKFFLAPHILES